jgi:hypothetical protein
MQVFHGAMHFGGALKGTKHGKQIQVSIGRRCCRYSDNELDQRRYQVQQVLSR